MPLVLPSNNFHFRIAAVVCLVGIAASSCDETPIGVDTELPPYPVIDSVRVLFDAAGREFFIEATVLPGATGELIDSVRFTALRPDDVDTSGLLFDDGSHGDIIAGDRRYSTRTDSTFAGRTQGSFSFSIQARDAAGAENPPVSVTFSVAPEGPPEITLLSAPGSLAAGDTIAIEIFLTDPQGLRDIRKVTYDIRPPPPDTTIIRDQTFAFRDDGAFGDRHPDDGVYTVHQPTDPGGRTGTFTFLVRAEDKAGLRSEILEIPVTITEP